MFRQHFKENGEKRDNSNTYVYLVL